MQVSTMFYCGGKGEEYSLGSCFSSGSLALLVGLAQEPCQCLTIVIFSSYSTFNCRQAYLNLNPVRCAEALLCQNKINCFLIGRRNRVASQWVTWLTAFSSLTELILERDEGPLEVLLLPDHLALGVSLLLTLPQTLCTAMLGK